MFELILASVCAALPFLCGAAILLHRGFPPLRDLGDPFVGLLSTTSAASAAASLLAARGDDGIAFYAAGLLLVMWIVAARAKGVEATFSGRRRAVWAVLVRALVGLFSGWMVAAACIVTPPGASDGDPNPVYGIALSLSVSWPAWHVFSASRKLEAEMPMFGLHRGVGSVAVVSAGAFALGEVSLYYIPDAAVLLALIPCFLALTVFAPPLVAAFRTDVRELARRHLRTPGADTGDAPVLGILFDSSASFAKAVAGDTYRQIESGERDNFAQHGCRIETLAGEWPKFLVRINPGPCAELIQLMNRWQAAEEGSLRRKMLLRRIYALCGPDHSKPLSIVLDLPGTHDGDPTPPEAVTSAYALGPLSTQISGFIGAAWPDDP